ncbi:hypothetical protein MP228_005248 [Amoeboaphelidium protococcarum]|nr:hypothetical protein MP228_005248 [Amoeboaphelidium protococcarum]
MTQNTKKADIEDQLFVKNQQCNLCQGQNKKDWLILCSHCKHYVHLRCEGLNYRNLNAQKNSDELIQQFECKQCKSGGGDDIADDVDDSTVGSRGAIGASDFGAKFEGFSRDISGASSMTGVSSSSNKAQQHLITSKKGDFSMAERGGSDSEYDYSEVSGSVVFTSSDVEGDDPAGDSDSSIELHKEEEAIKNQGLESDEEQKTMSDSSTSSSSSDHDSEVENVPLQDTKTAVCQRKTQKRSLKVDTKRGAVSNDEDEISVDVVQQFLEQRGIKVSELVAQHLVNNPSIVNLIRQAKSQSNQSKGSLLSIDKEAKKLQALEAEAISVSQGTSQNQGDLKSRKRKSMQSESEDLFKDITSPATGKDVKHVQKNAQASAGSDTSGSYWNQMAASVDDMLNFESSDNDGDMPMSPPATPLQLRWDKIPIGTFYRRSRKPSAPVLKLSKAVRSSSNVSKSIHQTLLANVGQLQQQSREQHKNQVSDGSSDCSCHECHSLECNSQQHALLQAAESHQQQKTTMPAKRVRKVSMNIAELSTFIQDASHPPSACASPSALFPQSPMLSSVQNGQMPDLNQLDKFDLDGGGGGSNGTTTSSLADNGDNFLTALGSYTRRRRQSSLMSSIPVDQLFASLK